MAFIGIFAVGLFAVFFLFCVFVVFNVSLVISIINLVIGIKRNWPKKNIVLLSIFGSIALTIFLIALMIMVNGQVNKTMDSSSDISSLEVNIALAMALMK